MKTKHIFWGLLFVSIGILILLKNLGLLYLDLSNIWKFWPLVIILWGVSYFTKNSIVKTIIAIVAALILAITTFAFFNSSYNFVSNAISINDDDFDFTINSHTDTSNYVESFSPDTKSAELHFSAGAGAFIMNDSTDDLIHAVTQGKRNKYEFDCNSWGDKASVTMKMKEKHFNFNDERNKNRTLLKLNSNPNWDMNFNVGAAIIDFDFSPFKTDNIDIKMGAASLRAKLGTRSDVIKMHIKAGVSSLSIEIPESSGCELHCNTPLSSKDFENFNKVNNNLYKTDNFDSAKNKIYLDIDTGISSIHVARY